MTQLKFRADRGFVRAYRMIAALLALLLLAGFAPHAHGAERGSVTNLPLPRYVSIKSAEVNVRRGPSLTHRVDWVFKRKDMPVEITAEHGHWRRVRDRDGAGGWVHYSLLSGNRTVIVDQDMLPLLSRPEQNAPASAQLEQGVVARLDSCNTEWCRLSAGGYRGWAPKKALWGVKTDEVLD
ncbi:aspartyl-trna synthetase [Rhodobacteraceae bacterium EhC02]|nr:aspartyl-trna synthetase [Rhodobacteraceae bacterium EhC02]